SGAPGAAAPAGPAAPAVRPPVVRPPAAALAAARPAKAGAKPVFEDSNVREVLKALGDASATGETRLMRTPPAPREPAPASSALSDTQVLKMLETRRSEESDPGPAEGDGSGIPMLKPDDTGTRRALKEAVVSNGAVAFAVQLQWSVQAVELDRVPPLAIFSAYTLYTVEGSRDGRKWYGLRLGFFSDAISAKQVAYYVRSEFNSVAVVPVSPQERTRASDVEKKSELAFPKRARTEPVEEFKLIDSEEQPAAPVRPQQVTKAAAPAKAAPPAAAAGRRAPKPTGRVRAREHRAPQTLEETLEILGAGELEMDNGNGETLNESGVRHLRVEVQKNTPFGRLLERLSERVRRS